jgi:hypothetical protein
MKLGNGRLILLVAAAAASWWALSRLDFDVTWLTVEAPRHAVVGEVLPMHVHIAGLEESSQLCADLHWANLHDTSNGYLASGGAKPVGRQGGSFDFEIKVRATNGLHFVHGIIFLSPTGEWSNHTFAATTDLIPVTSSPDGRKAELVRLPVRLLEDHARDNVRPTAIPSLLTALLLLASSLVAWVICGSVASQPERSNRRLRRWQVLAAALALASVWEMFGLENWVWVHVRVLARAADVYYSRAVFQKATISVTIAATFVFLGILWRKQRSYQVLLVFFGLYLAIAVVDLLSLHSIDKIAGLSWLGVTLVESLKLVCAAATLKGVWQARQ